MKYSESGFRPLYHNFCFFPMEGSVEKVSEKLPGFEEADGVLTYGYYDREAGFTLEVLCCAKKNGDSQLALANEPEKIRAMMRIGSVEELEYTFVAHGDDPIRERFEKKMEMLSHYDSNEEVEKSRTFEFLDEFRHEHSIDDVLVFLVKGDLQPEGCWVRIEGLGEKCIIGTLLNEPNQNFGYHEGEKIGFFISENNGERHLIADMGPSMEISAEDLADGEMLREAIKRFNENRTQDNFIDVLEILRDSYVWIPCNAIPGENDQAELEKLIDSADGDLDSLIGKTFSNKENIRMVPDILQNGDNFFFPVFTRTGEMGEYGKRFSKLEKHFLEAIRLARGNDKKQELRGIVIDAFSEVFVLDKELWDLAESIKSRLEE